MALPSITDEERGDILEVRNQYQAAIAAYTKVERPSAPVWNKLGIAYQMLYDLQNAARCYKEALKLEPYNIHALNNLATVEDSLKDFPVAERIYRRALRLDPNSATILKNLGTNLLMQHQYGKGSDAYAQALRLDPYVFDNGTGPAVNDPAPTQERGTASYFKARSCARAGLNDCAITFLRRAFNEGSATAEKVANETDFDSMRNLSEFRHLLEQWTDPATEHPPSKTRQRPG